MRKSRQLQLADTGLFHKFFKGHNGEYIFATNAEKIKYLKCVCAAKSTPKITGHVLFYSYCIMSNHVHEVGKAGGSNTLKRNRETGITQLGNWMRNAHSRFGSWYNKSKQRSGAVTNGRASTTEMKSDIDTLNTMLYADANPVRARMITHPSKYKWSSYRFYAYGETNEFTDALDMPAAYLALGKTPMLRQKAYRSLMDAYLRRNDLLDDAPEDDIIDVSLYDSTFHCVLDLINRAQSRAGPD